MPIYEYKCNKCGVFEAMQGIKESPLRKCPTCKGKVERQMSRGSFILKGSGWYATDYAKKSSKDTEASESPKTNGDSSSASNGSASNGSNSSSEASKSGESSKSSDSTRSSSEASAKSSKESKQASESKSSSEKFAPAKAAD